jgi:biotin carboxylase
MKKTLIIIGAGLEQTQVYLQAKAMGLHVVGTDRNPQAPAFKEADESLICSTRDAEETVIAVKKYAESHPVHGVMTVANDVPLTVARVAQELGLPGIPPDCAKLAANKISMKQRFNKAEVATPAYQVFSTKLEFLKVYDKRGIPKILKPSDGRGSRGVLFLDGSTDPDWAWDESYSHSENGELMLEDYAPGPQLSVEGLMLNDKYHAVAFADRNYSNMSTTKPFIIEDGGIIPTNVPEAELKAVNSLIERAAHSMNIHWGPVKADIVLTTKGPQIIELAARLSGNYLATHHIPMAYGVNIVDSMIKLALAEEVDQVELVPQWKKYLGVRYFFPEAGIIKQIDGEQIVRNLDYVLYLDIYKKAGELQQRIQYHTTRAGTIICEADTYEEAFLRVEEATEMIKFIVTPPVSK